MAKELTKLEHSVFSGYVGLVDGLPDTHICTDEYGDAWRAEIFVAKSTAKKRYEDVRRVRIVIEEPI